MTADFIIVGQGISGSMLGEALTQKGASVCFIDDKKTFPSSTLHAGGLIHSLSGKRYLEDERYVDLMKLAIPFYHQIEEKYRVSFVSPCRLLFFQQMAHLPLIDAQEWESVSSKFNYNDIPVYWNGYKIGIRKMIEVIQQSFQSTGKYFVESFDVSQFKHNRKGVQYKDIHASKIIFCNGVSDMHTQWFKKLPFIKNRGDILILNIPELPVDDVYDLGVRLVHLHQQVWWCGANQQWSLNDMLPDTQWRDQVIERLTQQLNIDFKVEKHLVAQRPTTEGQFYLMGLHPQFTEIGLMNGMGSRGLTFAPVLAQRFAAYLCGATTKIESYNQSRFESFCV